MKKFLAILLTLSLALVAFAAVAEDIRVAMITDYGDITDQSFNQTTYEAAKAYCEANGIDFTYYKPAGDSTAERVAMVEKAADEDYNVIIMPGYAFGETIAEVQGDYPDIKFIALDVSAFDLGTDPASNVYCAVYQEELCGYMAGYAAVKLGYTHLGFLGGMAVPAVVRYGFGFVQGADAAAAETGRFRRGHRVRVRQPVLRRRRHHRLHGQLVSDPGRAGRVRLRRRHLLLRC